MFNLINTENVNALANVNEYSFTTAEGKSLTVKGELAKDLSVYFGMSTLGNKATFEQAHRLRNIMNMPTEEISDKYSVKNGETFITKYLGLAKGSISNYRKVADYFFMNDSSEIRDSEFAEYNFSQLQELSVYIVKYMDKKHCEFDEAYEALKEIVQGEYPYTMSCAKMRKAIKKEFEIVDEKTAETAETAETETAEETEITETETETAKDSININEIAFAVLNRCKVVLSEAFDDNNNYRGNSEDISEHFRTTLVDIIGMLEIK